MSVKIDDICSKALVIVVVFSKVSKKPGKILGNVEYSPKVIVVPLPPPPAIAEAKDSEVNVPPVPSELNRWIEEALTVLK